MLCGCCLYVHVLFMYKVGNPHMYTCIQTRVHSDWFTHLVRLLAIYVNEVSASLPFEHCVAPLCVSFTHVQPLPSETLTACTYSLAAVYIHSLWSLTLTWFFFVCVCVCVWLYSFRKDYQNITAGLVGPCTAEPATYLAAACIATYSWSALWSLAWPAISAAWLWFWSYVLERECGERGGGELIIIIIIL